MSNKKVGIGIGIGLLIIAIIAGILIFSFKDNNTYKVTFNLGNDILSDVVEVNANKTVSKPSDPTREGYTFEGWYYNGEKFDFSTKITEDIVLEARWISNSAQKWVVTFDSNGGNNIESLNVEDGKTIIDIPKPKRTGYTFVGWYYNGEKFDFSTVITQDITLKAKWKEKEQEVSNITTKFSVKFESNGGSAVKTQSVLKNGTVTKPADPVRAGYTFVGWYNEETLYDFSSNVVSSLTLVAKWEKIVAKYTVTFDSNGGSKVDKQIVEEGKTATKPEDPTMEGYTFVGWYYNDIAYNFATKVTNNVELVAKWQKDDVITYKLEETDSYVGQVMLFVLKNDVKVDGIVDVTTSSNKVIKNVEVSKDGYMTNSYKIKSIDNVRVK